MKKTLGLTLPELLCAVSIISILSTVAAPYLSELHQQSRSNHLYQHIFTLIQYIRSQSAFLYEDIILCPTVDELNCINDWQQPLMVFIDNNKNRRRDYNEAIDRKIDLLKEGEKFIWKASGTSRYMRFHTNGLTSSQNGSFTICPKISNVTNIRKIVLFYTGRARRAEKEEIKSSDCDQMLNPSNANKHLDHHHQD